MNKILFLVLIFSFLTFSCASYKTATKPAEKISGEWIFTEASTPQDICKSEVANIFSNSVLNFGHDKKFTLNVAGFEKKGAWSVSKRGTVLILGFDETINTDKRLKSFDISELTDSTLLLGYNYNEQNIILKFKKSN